MSWLASSELSVDRGSRGGVVFANRGALEVRHEEVIARHRECGGVGQPRCNEVGVNQGACSGAVLGSAHETEKIVR